MNNFATKSLALAAAYVFAAYLSLFLAIPPGYASPIWPAAGVALAGVLIFGTRILPGLFIGSLAINLFISYSNGTTNLWGAPTIVASSIALGATLQAFGSALWIKKHVRFPNDLENLNDLGWLVLIGGPIGCLINSLWGTLTLYFVGAVSIDSFDKNWLTWWIGDTLGVIGFTPVILLLLSSNIRYQIRRKAVVIATHGTVFALVLFTVSKLKNVETARLENEFQNSSDQISNELSSKIDSYKILLQAIDSFFNSSQYVHASEFETFTKDFFVKYPGVLGLSWNAKVELAEREGFETSIREQGFPDFRIKDLAPDGTFQPSPDRETYFPVTYTAPFDKNTTAHGFDVFANPLRSQAMIQAIESKKPIATGQVNIVQAPDHTGLLIYHPIFKESTDDAKIERQHIGYAVGIFTVEELVESTVEIAQRHELVLTIRDQSPNANNEIVFTSSQDSLTSPSNQYARIRVHPIQLDGADWNIEISESDQLVIANDGSSIWITLIGGCLFSALVGIFLLFVTGRTEIVQRLVNKKTAQLSKSNKELERLAIEAESANIAKSQFLAAMSHEIRTPMNGLMGVLHLLESDLSEENLELLETAQTSADDLLTLVNDILDFSKIEANKMSLEIQDIDTLTLTEEVCLLHSSSANEKGLKLSGLVTPENHRIIKGDSLRLKQILSNLIGNAVKFTNSGYILIECAFQSFEGREEVVFSILDSGIGIEESKQNRLFNAFTQADASTTRQYGGTGLGLSICKRLVELMNGSIELESMIDSGSKFTIRLPVEESVLSDKYYSQTLMDKEVLIVDSESGVRDHLSTWFKHWGAKPIAFENLNLLCESGNSLHQFDHVLIESHDIETESVDDLLRFDMDCALLSTPEDQDRIANPNYKHISKPIRIQDLARYFNIATDTLQRTNSKNPGSNASDLKILLVDDNHTNRLVATAILKRNYKNIPDQAEDGLAALKLLKRSQYDLILMDCMMPNLDGYKTTSMLRTGEAGELNQHTPVIALTANAMLKDRQECLDAGMSDHLTKPINPNELDEKINQWRGKQHVELNS